METHPIVIQAAFAIPIIVGVVIYMLLRWERTPLHSSVAALLSALALWLAAQTVKLVATRPEIRSIALDSELMLVAVMLPVFVVVMGHLARVRAFEESRAGAATFMVIPFLFAIVYFTDSQHHLVITDREAALRGDHPQHWAGTLYWGFQMWCQICNVVGISLGIYAVWKARTSSERRRVGMVLGALFCPVAAHLVYITGLQPMDYSLSPAALGPTVILFVYGIHRYRILDTQPIVRSDLIEHLGDGLVLADAAGAVLDANEAAETTLGAERGALKGMVLTQVLDLLSTEPEATTLRDQLAAMPLDGGRVDGEIQTSDGRAIELTAGSVAAKGYEPAGRFLSLRDRSKQRRSERLLQERQKLESVGTLAAGVAHEVNNPLAYVRSNLKHVQELVAQARAGGREPWADIPQILDESVEGLDRIGRIVETMLRFSRVPDERMEPVDLNEIMDVALRLAELHRNRAVKVDLELAPGIPPVLGSSARLVQVVLNLLLNGKQALAGHPNARIFVEIELDGDWAVLRIRDNGPGIPEENRQRIFDPFFTTRAPDEGTGLGLAIAFDIVREHGGTLELDDKAEAGTCFSIRLPVIVD